MKIVSLYGHLYLFLGLSKTNCEAYTAGIYFLTVMEARSLRSRQGLGSYLLRAVREG